MLRSKAEVDKHVESLAAKLSLKEFKSRAYSIARLYYDAGDYASCRRYVEQFLSVRERDAAAHKLLGLALQHLGEKEKALEQLKTSLEIDPSQTSLIIEICILLSDDEVFIDPGRARYWCERAQAEFPRHPATFNLRERLLAHTDPDPDALLRLLQAELQQRPRDAALHARLLKQYLLTKSYKEAFDHSFSVEFGDNTFVNNYAWYEVLSEVLALDDEGQKQGDWRRQLLELTVSEKLCSLSLADGPGEHNRSLIETASALHRYDQELQRIVTTGPPAGCADFHSALIHHHRGQLTFYAACFLLKKAKKEQLIWKEAVRPSSALFLVAWHTAPQDPNASWLQHAPEQQRTVTKRWHIEGSYRCSQAGHCLLAGIQDKNHTFIDRISQFCSGSQWKDKLYEKVFTNREQLTKSKTSYFLSDKFDNPTLRLPRRVEVQAYDVDAQKLYPNSLHHMVWMLLDYKNLSHFKCVLFEMLKPACQNYTNCGPETLNRLDVEAFIYAAALTADQHKKSAKYPGYQPADLPELLPANITDLLCSPSQMKWYDCAVKVSRNEVGTELSDIRTTVRRGIEVVRCVDNHGLDTQLLYKLATIFHERSKNASGIDDKENLESRASLYYAAAIPLLEKLRNKMVIRLPGKRMFEYSHKELSSKEIVAMLEESKLFMGEIYLNEGKNEKAIETLTGLKSARSSYLISKTYMKIASDEISFTKDHINSEDQSKHLTLLYKSKEWAYTTADRLKFNPDEKLEKETQHLIEKIEKVISNIDPDVPNSHEFDNRYSSDDNASSDNSPIEQLHRPIRGTSLFRNVSSTPKHHSISNSTHYKSAIDSTNIQDGPRSDRKQLERIESQIKSLYQKDCSMSSFMEHTKSWIDDNRHLGDEVRELKNNLADRIISKINSNIQDTVEQFKQLKLSVDQVKEKIGEYRDECKNDVGDLKKEVAELKKEIHKLKSSSDHTLDESDLYNLDEYQSNDTTPAFNAQLPFNAAQMLPGFNQRVPPVALPPSAYSLYGQNLYTLYNQFSQLAQAPLPSAPLFDPTRPVNYSGIYPTSDYAEVPHFPPPPIAPIIPPPQGVPPPVIQPPVIPPPVIPTASRIPPPAPNKEIPRSLPVNVVITSSDPMPPRTSVPQPIMSVTIPPQHLKNSPHNYQIPMPMTSTFNTSAATPICSTKPFVGWGQNTTPTNTTTSKLTLFDTPKSNTAVESPKVNFSGFNTSFTTPNTSLNKSRTLSEKSNTSVDYDPCPDFKPIIPLPDEVKVTTGEENETGIFSARAKLYRYTEKEWKERGLGEMKLLKHNVTGKVRVLMRREQIHKICANHVITPEINITPMKNETKAYIWVANDFADESVVLEKFCVRFKTAEIAKEFYDTFEKAKKDAKALSTDVKTLPTPAVTSTQTPKISTNESKKTVVGGFTFSSTPTFKEVKDEKAEGKENKKEEVSAKPNLFSGFSFKSQSNSPFANILTTPAPVPSNKQEVPKDTSPNQLNTSDVVEEFEPSVDFKPVVPLPALVEQKTGEEDETVHFEHRAKLLRFDTNTKEWKERGLGNIKILVNNKDNQKVRLLMRREIVMKVCCNHAITKDLKMENMPNNDKAVTWFAQDFAEGELTSETFCLRFKTVSVCEDFLKAIKDVQSKLGTEKKKQSITEPKLPTVGFGDQFKPKPGAWSCKACYTNNVESAVKCIACETPKESTEKSKPKTDNVIPQTVSNWGDKFKPKAGSWECGQCLIRNDALLEYCSACESPKDPSKPKKESKSILDVPGAPKFNFGIPTATAATAAPTISFGFSTPQNIIKSSALPIFGIPADTVKSTTASKSTFGFTAQTKTPITFSFGAPGTPTPFGIAPQKNEEEPSSRTVPFGQAKTLSKTPPKESTNNESGALDFTTKPSGKSKTAQKSPGKDEDNSDLYVEDEGHDIHFAPIIPLPDKVDVKTGEEDETEVYSHRAKLFRFTSGDWKERGVGTVKVLKHNTTGRLRVLMRREQIHKICLNHALTPEIIYTNKDDKTWLFTANDFSEGEISLQQFCLRFKSKVIADEFKAAVDDARSNKESVKSPTTSLKSSTSDEVLFVKEILASSEDKQKAKDLMLPENFYTYKDKPDCPGCRGCEHNEDKALATVSDSVNTPIKSPFTLSPSSSVFTTPMTMNRTSDITVFRTPTGGSSSSDDSSAGHDNASINKENSTPDSKNTALTIRPALLPTPTMKPKTENDDPKSAPGNVAWSSNKSIFEKVDPKSVFGSITAKPDQKASVFGSSNNQTGQTNTQSIFGTSVFGAAAEQQKSQPSLFGGSANPNTEVMSIFGNSQAKSVFASGQSGNKSVFGAAPNTKSIFGLDSEQKCVGQPIFGAGNEQKTEVKSIFGGSGDKPEVKSIFGSPKTLNEAVKPESQSIFGAANQQNSEVKSIFGGSGAKPEVKSIFGSTNNEANTAFQQKSIFGFTEPKADTKENKLEVKSIFGTAVTEAKPVFGSTAINSSGSIFGGASNGTKTPNVFGTLANAAKTDEDNVQVPFSIDNALSFAALSTSNGSSIEMKKRDNFKWEGAGQQLFSSATKPSNKKSPKTDNSADETDNPAADEEYDPHYEPIVPLPDEIVVTTGEEDEEKLFGERAKIFRYDENTHQWKERGVGELKILYHPHRETYRMLLRREQVYKAVLNTLLSKDTELLPMPNSETAWTWAGVNYAESGAGVMEMLACRFKTAALASQFKDKVVDVTRKLQVADARAYREAQEAAQAAAQSTAYVVAADSTADEATVAVEAAVPDEEAEYEGHDDDDYDEDYYNDEEHAQVLAEAPGAAVVRSADGSEHRPESLVQLLYDPDVYAHKLLLVDAATGEILADVVVAPDMRIEMVNATATWTGTDYTSGVEREMTVAFTFATEDDGHVFYESLQNIKNEDA